MAIVEREPQREPLITIPESERFREGQLAFQARILAALTSPPADIQLLNPENREVPELTADMLADAKKLDLTLIKGSSLIERTHYWEEKRRDIQRSDWYETWKEETTQAFTNEAFFSSRKGQEWTAFFQKLGITSSTGFSDADAERLYDTYFAAPRDEGMDTFVHDVLRLHTTTVDKNLVYDRETFIRNRDAVQWLARLFGEKHAHVLTQIEDALTKSPEEVAKLANENNRRNEITASEYEQFEAVYDPYRAIRRTTPPHIPHPYVQSRQDENSSVSAPTVAPHTKDTSLSLQLDQPIQAAVLMHPVHSSTQNAATVPSQSESEQHASTPAALHTSPPQERPRKERPIQQPWESIGTNFKFVTEIFWQRLPQQAQQTVTALNNELQTAQSLRMHLQDNDTRSYIRTVRAIRDEYFSLPPQLQQKIYAPLRKHLLWETLSPAEEQKLRQEMTPEYLNGYLADVGDQSMYAFPELTSKSPPKRKLKVLNKKQQIFLSLSHLKKPAVLQNRLLLLLKNPRKK
jgi:hypothetical protein